MAPGPIDPNKPVGTGAVTLDELLPGPDPSLPTGTDLSDLVRRALAATETAAPPLSPAMTALLGEEGAAPADEEGLFPGWQGQDTTYRRLTPLDPGQDLVIYVAGPDSKTDLAAHQLVQSLNRRGVTVWSYTPDLALDWTRHVGTMRAFVDFVRGQEPGKRIHLVAVSASSSVARLLVEESPDLASLVLIAPAFELTEARVRDLAIAGHEVPRVLLPEGGRRSVTLPTLALLAGNDREVVNERTERDLGRDFTGYHEVRTFQGRPHQIFSGEGAEAVVQAATGFLIGHPWEAAEAEQQLQFLLGGESLFSPGERQIDEENFRNNARQQRAILRHPAYRRLQRLYRDHPEELPPEVRDRATSIVAAVDVFFERQRRADQVDVRQLIRRFILPYPDVVQFALAGVSYYDNASLEEVETVDALRFAIERYGNAANMVYGDVDLGRSPDETWRRHRTHVRAVAALIPILKALPNYDDLLARNVIRPDILARVERRLGEIRELIQNRLITIQFGNQPFFPEGRLRHEEERWRLHLWEPHALWVHPALRRLQALYRRHWDKIPEDLRPRVDRLVDDVDTFFDQQRREDRVDSRDLVRRYLLSDPGIASFARRLLQPYGVELEEIETVRELARLATTLFNDAATSLMNDEKADRSAEESWRLHNLELNLAARSIQLLRELPIYDSLLARSAIRPDLIALVERRFEQVRVMVRDELVRNRALFPETPLMEDELPAEFGPLQRDLAIVSRAASLFGLDPNEASLLRLLSAQIVDLYPSEPLYARGAVAAIRAVYQQAYDRLLRLCGPETIPGMERSALIGQVRAAIDRLQGLLSEPPAVPLDSLPPATAEEIPSLTARLLETEELHAARGLLGYVDDDPRPFAAYGLKLRLLQASGIFPGTTLYLAGGMDYFPSAAGPLITVDRAAELGSGAFFGILRTRLGRLEAAQYLPTNEEARERVRMVRADLTDTAGWWPQVAGQNVRTLVLKNFAESVSAAGGDPEAVKRALRFVAGSLPPDSFVVLFAEDAVWQPLFEENGFVPHQFSDEVQRALSVQSGWGRLAFDTKLYYGIATVSGGPVIVLQKRGSGVSYRSSPPPAADPSRDREGEEGLVGSAVIGEGTVARELLPPLEEGGRRAFPEPDSPSVLETPARRLIP